MFVTPAPGRLVRDPVTKQAVPASGREVPETGYWHRRLRDGDVVVTERATAESISAVPAQDATA